MSPHKSQCPECNETASPIKSKDGSAHISESHAEDISDVNECPSINATTNSQTGVDYRSSQGSATIGNPSYQQDYEGWRSAGWRTVIGAFLLNCYTWGVVCSWTIYQVLYQDIYAGQTDEARLAFIGTLSNAVAFVPALFSGPILRRLGHRGVAFIGAAVGCPLSLVLASVATELWHCFLAQGILLGWATGMCYLSSSTLPSRWFVRNRALATGMSTSGCCIGPMIAAPLTQALIDALGYRNAMRVMAAIGVGICCIATLLIQVPPSIRPTLNYPKYKMQDDEPQEKRTPNTTEASCWKECDRAIFTWPFTFYLLHSLLVCLGYAPVYILSATYASMQLEANPTLSSSFLSILESTNGLSRIVSGWLADRYFGRINMLFWLTLLSGISTMVLWQFAANIPVYVIFCIVFGYTGGVYSSFQPVITAEIVGMDRFQQGVGLTYFVSAFGILFSAPTVGLFHQQYGWTVAIQFAGSTTVASALAVLVVRYLTNRVVMQTR